MQVLLPAEIQDKLGDKKSNRVKFIVHKMKNLFEVGEIQNSDVLLYDSS